MTIRETTTPLLRLLHHTAGDAPALHHITALPRRPLEAEQDLGALYEELAAELARQDLQLLQEKLFALASVSEAAAAARAEALARRGATADHLPATHVGCTPCQGGLVAGVQICAADSGAACRTLRVDGQAVGRQLDAGGARVAFVPDITGCDDQGHLPKDRTVQCENMFRRVTALVQALGFTFQDVARTWIYVDRLLQWYDELNRVRTAAYSELGVYDPQNFAALPASTGIQGAHPSGAECFMDLLLVSGDPATPPARPMRSTHQCEAGAYGSSFSRGKRVEVGGARLLYVSGTASIDLSGATVHLGDHRQQVLETMDAVQNLLSAEQTDLAQIVTSVLFFKKEQGFAAWQELCRQGRLPSFPGIPVYADVCRDDLLFEVEPLVVLDGP